MQLLNWHLTLQLHKAESWHRIIAQLLTHATNKLHVHIAAENTNHVMHAAICSIHQNQQQGIMVLPKAACTLKR